MKLEHQSSFSIVVTQEDEATLKALILQFTEGFDLLPYFECLPKLKTQIRNSMVEKNQRDHQKDLYSLLNDKELQHHLIYFKNDFYK